VVIADQPLQQSVAGKFEADGWSVRELAGYWLLAAAPPR
jgi:hypothetical protein